MNLLAVDTSTPMTILAHCHYDGAWKIERVSLRKPDREHDNWLELQTEEFTREFPLEAYDGFAVGSGPGSFTGLRIGFTYFKALAILWNRSFMSFPTASLLNALFLDPGEILLIQMNANLYMTCDQDQDEKTNSLENWLAIYENRQNNLLFWNFYNHKKPFPENLVEFNPEHRKPAMGTFPRLPDPADISGYLSRMDLCLPDYGFNVELKRKNHA